MKIEFARGACVWDQGKYKDYIATDDIATAILARSDSANAVLIGMRVDEPNEVQAVGAVVELGHLESGTGRHQSNTVYDTSGLSPALTTIQGGTQQVKVLVREDE